MKTLRENGLDIQKLPLMESLMSIGNGYMGSRGYLEEFEYPGSVRGNYINGLYEWVPMVHAEWAWGFPLKSDRMPNLLDVFKITIFLDDEEVVIDGDIDKFKRELNFEKGLSTRSYVYTTKLDKLAQISFEQLISFPYPQLRTWTINIEYDGEIIVRNNIDFNISNVANKKDPRIAPSQITLVKVSKALYEANVGNIWLNTLKSGLQVKINFTDKGDFNSTWDLTDEKLVINFKAYGNLELNRTVKYCDSIRNNFCEFVPKKNLYNEQKEYLDEYNSKCGIDFLDNKELDNAMDFIEFQILQSTSRDSFGNIASKGLSGEGYEGHYFWDTEMFLFPVWLMWNPEIANYLLQYRYNLLPAARARAKELGHRKGACFPWRTISGIESSGYFSAGTAQYHLNFDIAYTFIQWWLLNNDMDYLENYSMELLIETARTALEIGCLQSDGFHIHTVTGPDEYTALVSDNYYTNKMAQYNLNWAVKLWGLLKEEKPKEWIKLKNKLQVTEQEIEEMKEAAEKMFFIYDDEKGIMAQDSTFLKKAYWPKENNLRPLLLHYHPLTIYRYQILKQADTVLAQYLINDEDEDIISRTFDYYDSINTHDSSLSKCISGLMSCKLKKEKQALDFFMDSIYLDLKNLNQNTQDGLHMANIGGSLLFVLKGFAGIRFEENKLILNPFVPKELGRLRIRFTYKKALLEILIEGEKIDIKKISGPPVNIILRDQEITIGQKAVLFDLDGVLTGTSDNHYEAWKRLAQDLGFDLPESFRDSLRGISRAESLKRILDYFDLKLKDNKILELSDKKNKYYAESIETFTHLNLYPGVIKLLTNLKSKNIKLGLVSASKNAKSLIKNMKIENYFDVVLDPDTVKKGKPNPDPFLWVADSLGVNPLNCLGVEDAKAGITSINSAGMFSVGIGEENLQNADISFSSIEEASQFIIDWVDDDYGRN
ncbi:MAG: beta-phosphoglucomutase [Gudongella sp.]|nr:beta-phosphoglucomutase [Gudongella sp.]